MERNMDESRKQFLEWWRHPEQEELRKSCAEGWGEKIWSASRATIELDIDWPEANDDTWKDGEDGAYAMGHEDGKDKTAIAVMKAIRAAGIKVKE